MHQETEQNIKIVWEKIVKKQNKKKFRSGKHKIKLASNEVKTVEWKRAEKKSFYLK